MDDRNYLDIAPPDRKRFVYRIISLPHLFDLFRNGQNVLVKPKKWEDPFENFILNSKVQLPTGKIATLGFRDHFYGQCWTLHIASDAMWRIYSPTKDAVRIRTTIQKLAESLSQTCGERAFIGKVKYLQNKRLIEYATSAFNGADFPSSKTYAQTLLIKRLAFRHEREVRLLTLQHDDEHSKGDLYAYSVDPHNLIDQIMIDPRMPKNDAESLKEKIKAQTSFKGSIMRSLLYAAPPDMVLAFAGALNKVSQPT
jgi:hypothetical protein